MSTEEAPVTPDTPTTQETADTDWQKRYSDLQPEYTRTTQALKDEQAIWEDEQAVIARIQEKFPHLVTDDNAEYDDDELDEDEDTDTTAAQPQPDPRVDEIMAWQAQQQYEKDLSNFVGDRELTEKGQQVIQALSMQGGHNADSLKKAVDTWFALKDEFTPEDEAETTEQPAKRRAPHVVAGGKAATSVPDFSDMSRDEIDQWMVDRARALDTQT